VIAIGVVVVVIPIGAAATINAVLNAADYARQMLRQQRCFRHWARRTRLLRQRRRLVMLSTASAAGTTAEAMEEEEDNGCHSANLRCHLDIALISLADGILLRLAAATAAGSPATVLTSIPAINIVAVHWGRGSGGQGQQRRRDRGQRRHQCGSGRVPAQFFGGRAPPILGGVFWEEDNKDKDDGDE